MRSTPLARRTRLSSCSCRCSSAASLLCSTSALQAGGCASSLVMLALPLAACAPRPRCTRRAAGCWSGRYARGRPGFVGCRSGCSRRRSVRCEGGAQGLRGVLGAALLLQRCVLVCAARRPQYRRGRAACDVRMVRRLLGGPARHGVRYVAQRPYRHRLRPICPSWRHRSVLGSLPPWLARRRSSSVTRPVHCSCSDSPATICSACPSCSR